MSRGSLEVSGGGGDGRRRIKTGDREEQVSKWQEMKRSASPTSDYARLDHYGGSRHSRLHPHPKPMISAAYLNDRLTSRLSRQNKRSQGRTKPFRGWRWSGSWSSQKLLPPGLRTTRMAHVGQSCGRCGGTDCVRNEEPLNRCAVCTCSWISRYLPLPT
jgi:hypothetical protein